MWSVVPVYRATVSWFAPEPYPADMKPTALRSHTIRRFSLVRKLGDGRRLNDLLSLYTDGRVTVARFKCGLATCRTALTVRGLHYNGYVIGILSFSFFLSLFNNKWFYNKIHKNNQNLQQITHVRRTM